MKTTDKPGFPAILKALRKANGLSVREGARRFGISPSLLQRYESGEVDPSMTKVGTIADALGVSVDTLMGRRGAA